MLRPTIFANITLASHATHAGLFARLSRLPDETIVATVLCNIDRNHEHRMNDAVETPIKDPQAEAIGLQRNCPVCGVSIFVVHSIEALLSEEPEAHASGACLLLEAELKSHSAWRTDDETPPTTNGPSQSGI